MNGKTTLTMNAHYELVCNSVSHISWGSEWVGALQTNGDEIQSWGPQVPEVRAVDVCTIPYLIISNRDNMSVRALTYDVLCLGAR
jgi:hypothetical protein